MINATCPTCKRPKWDGGHALNEVECDQTDGEVCRLLARLAPAERIERALRWCIEGLEGSGGPAFWTSPLGKRLTESGVLHDLFPLTHAAVADPPFNAAAAAQALLDLRVAGRRAHVQATLHADSPRALYEIDRELSTAALSYARALGLMGGTP